MLTLFAGPWPKKDEPLGLIAFLWSLRTGQFEDLDGAAYRALEDEPPEDEA